jgi:hypothetical protein
LLRLWRFGVVAHVNERLDRLLSLGTRKFDELNDGLRPTAWVGVVAWFEARAALSAFSCHCRLITGYAAIPKIASQRSRGNARVRTLETILVHHVTTLCGTIPNMLMRLCLSLLGGRVRRNPGNCGEQNPNNERRDLEASASKLMATKGIACIWVPVYGVPKLTSQIR